MLVGLNGQLSSGKDTVYLRAKELFPEIQIERRGFADKLKDSACALLGISCEEMEEMKRNDDIEIGFVDFMNDYHWRPDSGKITMRLFLQRYGTEAHRDIFGDDFWVEQAMKDLEHEGKIVFFTDCRFPNEVAAIREAGGEIWEIIGPNYNLNPTHPSEQILDRSMIDYIVLNSIRDDGYANIDASIINLVKAGNVV